MKSPEEKMIRTIEISDSSKTHLGLKSRTSSCEKRRTDLATQVKRQNAYRQSLGLEPLPDLLTITHDAPAVAESDEGDEGDEPEVIDDADRG